jgi:hypothetical protein
MRISRWNLLLRPKRAQPLNQENLEDVPGDGPGEPVVQEEGPRNPQQEVEEFMMPTEMMIPEAPKGSTWVFFNQSSSN